MQPSLSGESDIGKRNILKLYIKSKRDFYVIVFVLLIGREFSEVWSKVGDMTI